jgi:hypothetical protein
MRRKYLSILKNRIADYVKIQNKRNENASARTTDYDIGAWISNIRCECNSGYLRERRGRLTQNGSDSNSEEKKETSESIKMEAQ